MLVALLFILMATCAVLVAVNFQEDPDAALEKLKKVQVSSLCIGITMATRVIVCVWESQAFCGISSGTEGLLLCKCLLLYCTYCAGNMYLYVSDYMEYSIIPCV